MTSRVRHWLSAVARHAANVLQPWIAKELRAERPDIHANRQRVHYLVILAELARLRKYRGAAQ